MTTTIDAAVTEPGLYPDMSNETYHADPVPAGSLSNSGAKKLLAPSCPAIFKWERDNPPESKKTFDLGTAAHDLVLGKGPGIVRVDRETWNTNAVKEEVAAIRSTGAVPLKPSEYQQVHEMAEAIRRHPIAGALFDPSNGTAEVSGFWIDEESGIWRRVRPDWLPNPRPGRRLIVPDYKTTVSAEPKKFTKSAFDFGYHQQAPWYLDGLRALDVADEDTAFVFVAQEKTAPYLISVVQLDATAMRIGAIQNRRAIDIYAECTSTGIWPGYSDDVEHVSAPVWIQREFEDQL